MTKPTAQLVGQQIPAVTQHDLEVFQSQHFGTHQKACLGSEHHDEDEGPEELSPLGYYPDGHPRNITDAEISIFRHSEIHALLREREIRLENEESLPASERELEVTEPIRNSASTQKVRPHAITSDDQSSGKRNRPVSSHRDISNGRDADTSGMRGDYTNRLWQNKRGRANEPHYLWTERRRAREADEIKSETLNLDYD